MGNIKPYYERDGITIYCGDCSQVMRVALQADNIDLTVTSPPYDDLREYNGYTFEFEPIAAELWRVTKPGGVVVWVVADATINGSETGTSFRQALGFMGLGFNLHDTMIYQVAGTGAKGSNKAYWQEFEFMFVFAKGNINTFNLIADKKNKTNGAKGWGRRKNGNVNKEVHFTQEIGRRGNVWRYSGGRDLPDYERVLVSTHPARFPEALARDHIISWSNPGDIVLDPMCGSGTTLKMAHQLGRRAIGIEISEEYCRIAVDRLRQPSFYSLPAMQPKEPEAQQLTLTEER